MFLLRYLYILALVIWLGGMVVAGAIVAPSIFEVLADRNVAESTVIGGAVFGEVLRRIHVLGYAMGGLMIVTLALRRLIGSRPLAGGIRAGIIAAMLAFSFYASIKIDPQVAKLTKDVAAPMASLPATDPRKVEFDRLHTYSTWLFGFTTLGGLVLLFWEAREDKER